MIPLKDAWRQSVSIAKGCGRRAETHGGPPHQLLAGQRPRVAIVIDEHAPNDIARQAVLCSVGGEFASVVSRQSAVFRARQL